MQVKRGNGYMLPPKLIVLPSPAPAPTGSGMAFAIGYAVANRAVDALMGPRRVTIQHEAALSCCYTLQTMANTSSISGSDACSITPRCMQFFRINKCINEFLSDTSKCQWYMDNDKLYECKKNSSMLNA
ncbi:unnamed protein product [Malus baccata var. baccata]